MKNILFISGSSGGDALTQLGLSMKKGFADIDVNLYFSDLRNPDFYRDFSETLNERTYEFAFAFVGIGKSWETAENKNLWEAVKLPFISLYGDSPSYFFDFHKESNKWNISLYAYEEHLKFRKKFPHRCGFYGVSPVFPLPPVNVDEVDLTLKKKGKIIFLKNGNDPLRLQAFWKNSLQSHVYQALMEISESMLRDLDSCSHEQIVQNVLNFFAICGLQETGTENLLLLMVAQLDDYFRRVKSQLVANILLDYPAEIHGENWEHLNTTGRHGTLIPSGDYLKSNKLIAESLCIFDMSPNTLYGFHDRQMRCHTSQTLCMTNEQPSLEKCFGDIKPFSYSFQEESIREKVEWLLSNRDEAIELGVELGRKFDNSFSIKNSYLALEKISALTRQNLVDSRIEGGPPYFSWPPIDSCKPTIEVVSSTENNQETNVESKYLLNENRSFIRRLLSKIWLVRFFVR